MTPTNDNDNNRKTEVKVEVESTTNVFVIVGEKPETIIEKIKGILGR